MRPHAREKRVVDRKVNVTKKDINKNQTTRSSSNTLFDLLKKVVKK